MPALAGFLTPRSSKQADLDAMLEWARRMKHEKNFEAAEKSFVMVLGADAPETMHQCQSARKLGISVRTPRNKLNEYGIVLKDEEAAE